MMIEGDAFLFRNTFIGRVSILSDFSLTPPTVSSSRLLMEELVNHMERVPKAQTATCWKNK